MQATEKVTERMTSTVDLLTHTTIEPWQRVKLAFLGVLRRPGLLYIHARAATRLLRLFLPSTITVQWLSACVPRSLSLLLLILILLTEQII